MFTHTLAARAWKTIELPFPAHIQVTITVACWVYKTQETTSCIVSIGLDTRNEASVIKTMILDNEVNSIIKACQFFIIRSASSAIVISKVRVHPTMLLPSLNLFGTEHHHVQRNFPRQNLRSYELNRPTPWLSMTHFRALLRKEASSTRPESKRSPLR